MWTLSGYDGEVVGFSPESGRERGTSSGGTQTAQVKASGVGCQGVSTRHTGTTTEELPSPAAEGTHPGLEEFLRRVVPRVLEQLDGPTDAIQEDSDDDEEPEARLLWEAAVGGADGGTRRALACAWDAGGGALAVSAGEARHPAWCEHPARVWLYRERGAAELPAAAGCATALAFHPRAAGPLAAGSAAGEVRVYREAAGRWVAAARRHAGAVGGVAWADGDAADALLTRHVAASGERRGAGDRVLVSAGTDGRVLGWRFSARHETLDPILEVDLSSGGPPPELTCVDVSLGVVRAGTRAGAVLECSTAEGNVREVREHGASVVWVGGEGSLAADGEVRAGDALLRGEGGVGARWLPGEGGMLAVAGAEGVRLCCLREPPFVLQTPLLEASDVTAIDVTRTTPCLVGVGCAGGEVRVWELSRKTLTRPRGAAGQNWSN